MAPPPRVSDNPEVQAHYALQVGITAALVQALRKFWPLVDRRDLKGTLPAYTAAVGAVVNQYSLASASFGADFYDTMRAQAGISTPFRPPMVDPPHAAQVDAAVGWATQDLWSPTTTAPDAEPAADVETTVQQKVESVAQKLVADTGRNELIAAIEADTEARGFARVTKPGACAFCLMLATRGAVYASRESAGVVKASTKWADAKGEINRYHDNCHCTVVPLFGRHYEPPAHIREAMALYEKATKGKSDKLNAFRRALAAQRNP